MPNILFPIFQIRSSNNSMLKNNINKRINLHCKVILKEIKENKQERSTHHHSHHSSLHHSDNQTHPTKHIIEQKRKIRNTHAPPTQDKSFRFCSQSHNLEASSHSFGFGKSHHIKRNVSQECLNHKVEEITGILKEMKKEGRELSLMKKNGWMAAERKDIEMAKKKIKEKLSKKSWRHLKCLESKQKNKLSEFALDGKQELRMDEEKEQKYLQYKDQNVRDFCQFGRGFIEDFDKEVETGPFSLSKFEKSRQNSETIQALAKNMSKTGYFKNIQGHKICPNLISVVYADEYKKRNGATNCRLKKILKASNCLL